MPRNAPIQCTHSRLAWKLATAIVTIASSVWVLWLLVETWPDLAAHAAQIRTVPLFLGFALSLAASWLTFEAFATLVRMLGISGLPNYQAAHLYFTAQLLKHLPGRVWGIGYQWAAGREIASLGDWLLINAAHAFLATYFALWSSGVVLASSREAQWGLLAAVAGCLLYIAGWLLIFSRLLRRWFEWLPGRIGTLGRGMLVLLLRTPASVRVWVFVLFALSSLIYYAGWFMYGASYAPLGGYGGVQLCALYMLAWFAGYISLLTPSGLGVRELVFAWLAREFPSDAVVLMAVIGRASLLVVDLAMGSVFARFAPRKS
jgi:hypothetical protein